MTSGSVSSTLCSMKNNFKRSNVIGLGLDMVFLGLDYWTSDLADSAAAGVSNLARLVQKGGKIVKGIQVGFYEYKSLRLAAKHRDFLVKLAWAFDNGSNLMKALLDPSFYSRINSFFSKCEC